MESGSERGVSDTLERQALVRRAPALLRAALRLATGSGLVLLSGCPQILDDDFRELVSNGGGVNANAGASGSSDVDAGDGGTRNGSGGSGGGDAGGSAPAGPATVVDTLPADGAVGVRPDATLVITFGTPMDTASVEAAYVSSDLPRASVSFAWSEDDTVLSIVPDSALQAASGTDPDLVTAVSYTLTISSDATDKLGNALVESEISFSVARSITQSVKAVQDRDLTGNWRSDGTYGVVDCERAATTICIGDGALTANPNPVYKGLISFELSPLPSDLIEITAAELSLVPESFSGSPFDVLGTLQIEHVEPL
jgi:hypothetical protein